MYCLSSKSQLIKWLVTLATLLLLHPLVKKKLLLLVCTISLVSLFEIFSMFAWIRWEYIGSHVSCDWMLFQTPISICFHVREEYPNVSNNKQPEHGYMEKRHYKLALCLSLNMLSWWAASKIQCLYKQWVLCVQSANSHEDDIQTHKYKHM